ncbi:MAG: signal peptidase I [Alterinioella nitratireducens]|jgi:signal peptidase I|uniref:signal peptidase I n=1 Tax=Alterinioella nitratireducens TaxID=2735915 RepID=UPI000C3B22F6|nr:signal peptidase I [Alterinioella nitratireducens]MAX73487.1 signal peptidase I [Nioella sp.]NPD20022.1 signal peptidase I [Alterinioella nitratireducens]
MAAAAKKKDGIWETVKTVVYALLIAGVFRTLFFQPFWIPSGSMKDTLLIGDFLFVNKMAYGYSRYSCPFAMCPFSGRIWGAEPERGDVIVFRHPTQNTDFIKRVVGLPGDSIQMRNGVLYVNGQAATLEPEEPFVEVYDYQGPQRNLPLCSNRPVGLGGECEHERFTETLPGGVEHSVLNAGDGLQNDNTAVFVVPEGQYFVMGDNRDNSSDSRVPRTRGGVGFVPYENIIGRADRIMFSSAGERMVYFWTWRGDRFFRAVE